MSGKEPARTTRRRSPPGVVEAAAAATTVATDLMIPHEVAERVTTAMIRTEHRSVRRRD